MTSNYEDPLMMATLVFLGSLFMGRMVVVGALRLARDRLSASLAPEEGLLNK
jgi:hypothetical protein